MRILILGSKGNLGSRLVEKFSEAGEVIGWDKEEIDITDRDLVMKKVGDIKPGLIINAVAYNAVDKCEEDDREFALAKKVNGEAVGYLADAALSVGAKIIHYSTDYVFDGKDPEGYSEEDETDPVNKYGESKRMGEKELISRSGKGLKWYLIRTSKLFGPPGTSEAAKPGFFDMMLNLAEKKDELKIVNAEISCFTYTVDLARATFDLWQGEKGFGIYHLVNEKPVSWYQGAKKLFRLAGVDVRAIPVKPEEFPRPAKRPAFSVLKNTKYEKLRTYEEALGEYLKTKNF